MTAAVSSAWRKLRYTRLRDLLRGRLDASLDWQSVVAAANLPAEICSVIEQVVGRARLWRREQLDVATELVAHFQDGLEAGVSPDELVRSFGDPRQTAQLVRRAKKRGRSLVWQIWRYGCWACGAIVVAYLAAGLWMLMDRPSVTTDYLAIINERALAVPASEKAWPLYREALLAMNAKNSAANPVNPFVAASASKPGDANWAQATKFLKENANAIATLRKAAARKDLGFVATTSLAAIDVEDRELFGVKMAPEEIKALKDCWLISTLLPHLDLLRSAALLLANDARLAAAAGDGDTAMNDVTAILGMSRHVEETPFLVTIVVAEVMQRQALIVIQGVLREHSAVWTNDQLRDLAHKLAVADIDWRRGYIGERASFYDSMQRIYTDDGNGDGRLARRVTDHANLFELLDSVTSNMSDQPGRTPLANAGLSVLAMPAANMVVASRKEMLAMYDRLSDHARAQLETPLWELKRSSVDDELRAMQQLPLGKYRYLFVNLLLPACDNVRNRYETARGSREGVLIGIALELYHREHGKWPEALAELSPRWLPELPVDRITGAPLKYKIVADRPFVYSVGVDEVDDSGRPPRGDDGYAGTGTTAAPESGAFGLNAKKLPKGDWVIWSTAKGTNEKSDL